MNKDTQKVENAEKLLNRKIYPAGGSKLYYWMTTLVICTALVIIRLLGWVERHPGIIMIPRKVYKKISKILIILKNIIVDLITFVLRRY